MTFKDLKGMKVESKVTGYIYTILDARNHRHNGPEIKINNYAGYSGISWWPIDRFNLIVDDNQDNWFTFTVVVK